MFRGTKGFSPKELCGRLLPMLGVGGKLDRALLGDAFFISSGVGYILRFGLSAFGSPISWKPKNSCLSISKKN